jgi:hypothetical protein
MLETDFETAIEISSRKRAIGGSMKKWIRTSVLTLIDEDETFKFDRHCSVRQFKTRIILPSERPNLKDDSLIDGKVTLSEQTSHINAKM